MKNIVDEILGSIPSYEKRANRISNDIAAQIYKFMKESNINQRQLAEKLKKKESEISKWLNGNHNFTIETISKIEEIFGKNIITVPVFAEEDLKYKFIPAQTNIIDFMSEWSVISEESANFDTDNYPNIKKDRLCQIELLRKGKKVNLTENSLTSTNLYKNGTYDE